MPDLVRQFVRSLSVREKYCRGLSDRGRVLDIGCGTGTNGGIVRRLHPSVEMVGIDLISAEEVPPYYEYKRVDLDKDPLPFPDECFDAVIFTHVIEHLRAPWSLGKEINRVMKRGATIYVEAPNWTAAIAPSFGFHREQHDPFNFYDDPTHVRPWSRQSLFDFLSQPCRLKVVRVGSTRRWLRIPLDLGIALWGIAGGQRARIVFSFWNLYGWCIYGIGMK